MFLDFKGKTALVTGAAGAIGKGIAAGYLQCGANVFITDIDQKAIDAAVKELSGKEGKCAGLAADVTKEEQVKAVVAGAKQLGGGKVHILANVAGIVGQAKIEEETEAQWDKIFAVNCKGSFFFIKQVVPLMKAQKYGKIVNFSSKSGKTGSALMTAYSAAKAAVMGMTQALAFELANDNIMVNCVCPGITDHTGVWKNVSAGYIDNMKMSREDVIKTFTSKIPLKRLASIDDVVALTIFLSSKGSDYMTGQSINVTGGREMH
ncbi:MAG TPA: SDR family NAD(P)-dependent oxidoreductase [Planctomycetota bacterium]|jgi:NAD(P)-dependent dehydrogenase (short-subunit alcohol dehydrogenase family)